MDQKNPALRIDIPAPEPHVYEEMYGWARDLFPLCRSLTGNGVRQTLRYLRGILPDMEIREIRTGTKCFDWEIPEEWNIRDAYIADERGTKIVDFKSNNLHVLGYSVPVDKTVSLSELQEHLYSSETQPDAVPYVTSYFKRRWGFCVSHRQRTSLREGAYRVFIDSSLSRGSMTYGELIVPGAEKSEILISTNVCHPSLANNELSGPVVTAALGRWLSTRARRNTFRLLWIPETLGAIAYLSRNLQHMKRHVVAGFTMSCVGDERAYSFVPSRLGGTLADRVAQCVLRTHVASYKTYSYLNRGSDERQYCSPGVDLPVVSVMRSKYNTYPEYHTSLDNLELISSAGLGGSYEIYKAMMAALEYNFFFRATTLGEPFLAKRNLYPDHHLKELIVGDTVPIVNILAYADGEHDLIGIAERAQIRIDTCLAIIRPLLEAGLLEATARPSGVARKRTRFRAKKPRDGH